MNIRQFIKTCRTSVTILVVPHSRSQPVKVRLPLAGIFICIILTVVGAFYTVLAGFRTAEYYAMKGKLSYFTREFNELKLTIASLNTTNDELSRLVELKSKNSIIKNAEFDDTGSINVEAIKKEIEQTLQSVAEIKKYITEQKDIYLATPSGWPVKGSVSSRYGSRKHPVTGAKAFHTGIDIRVPTGTPVRATAAGIVSFAGWTSGGGHIVVIEHGHGFSTAYAHNSENHVKIGDTVKKGEKIASSGSSGVSTGPHLHYEVWKKGRQIDPQQFLKDG